MAAVHGAGDDEDDEVSGVVQEPPLLSSPPDVNVIDTVTLDLSIICGSTVLSVPDRETHKLAGRRFAFFFSLFGKQLSRP